MSTNSFSRQLDYALVDVFAERALEGNMLAIFTDARGLSTEQMQALARETNLAETTFILPADNPESERETGVRVRIFTVQEELPFAGHPTLGTASWLHLHHPALRGAQTITLALNVGPIRVRFEAAEQGLPGVFGTMQQPDPAFGATHPHAEVARILNLREEDLDARYPVQTVSTGMPFTIVLLRSMEAIGRLEIPQATAHRWLSEHDSKFFYTLCRTEPGAVQSRPADFHARMQFYNGEDPATGSASGCAISWLVRHAWWRASSLSRSNRGSKYVVRLVYTLRASMVGQQITCVFVGGRTIPVATGRFFLP